LVAEKVWEIRNLTFGFGFGFGVWMFIIRGVENGYGGWRTKKKSKKWEKGKKRERERERIYFKVFCLYF
jgi:nitrate reductase NapE component